MSVSSFGQLQLEFAYGGNLKQIDPWVGGLCEDHVDGAQVGELLDHILRNQFKRLRHGKRFRCESDPALTAEEKAQLSRTTLAKVISDNRNVD